MKKWLICAAAVAAIAGKPAFADTVTRQGSESHRGVDSCDQSHGEQLARRKCIDLAEQLTRSSPSENYYFQSSRLSGFRNRKRRSWTGERSCYMILSYTCVLDRQHDQPVPTTSAALPTGFDCSEIIFGVSGGNVCGDVVAAAPPSGGFGLTTPQRRVRTLVDLNVRASPSLSARRIGELQTGTCFTIQGCERGRDGHFWCKVVSPHSGYTAKSVSYQGGALVTFKNSC